MRVVVLDDYQGVATDHAQRIPGWVHAADSRAVVEYDVILSRRQRDFLPLFRAGHQRKLQHWGFRWRSERSAQLQATTPKIARASAQFAEYPATLKQPSKNSRPVLSADMILGLTMT